MSHTKYMRCKWVTSHPLYISYHDEEWGRPVHDDQRLFEFLILEGAQAGLSWFTVLKKREHYRKVFAQFDPKRVALFTAKKKKELLSDPGIIRNRLKVDSAVKNAQGFLKIQEMYGSFDHYIWQFVGGKPVKHRYQDFKDVPSKTPESDEMSKDLKRRGFNFVGSTICYAFMQAVGMVNDHTQDCYLYNKNLL